MANRTKRTPKKEEEFLAVLRKRANVSEAASAIRARRATVYEWREQNERFAKAWDDAIEEAVDGLEGIAWQRAREQSDTLVIFLLKAHRAQKYQDRMNIRVERKNLDEMTSDQLEEYERELERRAGIGSRS